MSWLPAPPSDKGGLGAQDNGHLDSGLGKLYNSPERFDMPVPHLDSGLGRLYNLRERLDMPVQSKSVLRIQQRYIPE